MASVFMVIVVHPLHLDAGSSGFGEQSAVLNFVRFYARRHDIHHNLENGCGVWLIQCVLRSDKEQKPPWQQVPVIFKNPSTRALHYVARQQKTLTNKDKHRFIRSWYIVLIPPSNEQVRPSASEQTPMRVHCARFVSH